MLHVITPLIDSSPLARAFGAPVHLKLETLQPSGSFKLRGIGRACEEAWAIGRRRFVSSSGGNAGLALAYAGRLLGAEVPPQAGRQPEGHTRPEVPPQAGRQPEGHTRPEVTVFVPRTTSARMIAKMRDEGAIVEVRGETWDDAHAAALEHAARHDAFYVHPFDMPAVWRGNATIVTEAVDQGLGRPGVVVVAVGGGGLLCGVLEGMHAVGWTDVPVLAVETDGAASLHAAIAAGHPVDIGRITSIATTLGARRVCDRVLAWTREHPVRPWLVSDRAAVEACLRFADDHRLVVEPSCGAALAAVYDRAQPLQRARSVFVVACGGAGATPADLVRWDATVGSDDRA